MTEPLRILSIGAGAIGTYIGGSLALAGHHVAFVERPGLVEDLRRRGLRLRIDGVEREVREPRFVDSIEKALADETFDAILFALKSYDTARFLDSLKLPPDGLPPLVCFSNGVDNEPAIAAALGPGSVLAGTVTSAVGRRDVGDIVLEKLRGTGVARPDSGDPALGTRLVGAMDAAGLRARSFDRADEMKWSKLLTNLIGNATSAILDMPPGELFANPTSYQLEIEQLRECLRVMVAGGIRVVDLPGIPVRLLARAVRYLPLVVSRPLLRRAVDGGRGGKMPSFHIDLHAGHGKSEVDFLNGAIVRAGREHEVPTPVNELLTRTLLALTRGEIAPDAFRGRPDRLLAEVGRG